MSKFLILVVFIYSNLFSQNWERQEMEKMPESVTNNAVCEGYIGETPFVFSFGGIDSSLIYSGIHNKAWRYNVADDIWESISGIPGAEKTIASSASYFNGEIFIIGGYTVASNGTELSSNKVHIYNINSDNYSSGANIPIPIDDHVQCIYKDSLIFIVTGWSNTGNIAEVQIYDIYNDVWQIGTSVANNNDSKVFGANGIIVGDTLYYYGGANTTTNFPATNRINKGFINPNDPTDILWTTEDLFLPNSYRMACTSIGDSIYWIGGSEISYNFDAEAYNGSGIVAPANTILKYIENTVEIDNSFELPMDLRGIASFNDAKFICGGIEINGKVSNKLLKLTWEVPVVENIFEKKLEDVTFENPLQHDFIVFSRSINEIEIYNIKGEKIYFNENLNNNILNIAFLENGIYYLKIHASSYKLLKL